MNEWVEIGPEGTLQGFTIVRFPYFDPNNGQLMKVPFTAVWITLDGAYTRMMHFCDELDEHKLEVGMRMRAVWAKEPRPTSIHAVEYFEVIADQEAEKVVGAKERGTPAKAAAPARKAKKSAKKKAAPKRAKKAAPAKKKAAKKPAKKKTAKKKVAAKPKKAARPKAGAATKPAKKKPAAKKTRPAKKKATAKKK
jgi:outer membrane biosynthesis protein TonB